jgi:hypothetical protein
MIKGINISIINTYLFIWKVYAYFKKEIYEFDFLKKLYIDKTIMNRKA